MPANIPPASVSAGNKRPSFTVCWLIYTNYRSSCSREDDRIPWDESIKSLLSGGVLLHGGDGGGGGGHGENQDRPPPSRCKYHMYITQAHRWVSRHTKLSRSLCRDHPNYGDVLSSSTNGHFYSDLTSSPSCLKTWLLIHTEQTRRPISVKAAPTQWVSNRWNSWEGFVESVCLSSALNGLMQQFESVTMIIISAGLFGV